MALPFLDKTRPVFTLTDCYGPAILRFFYLGALALFALGGVGYTINGVTVAIAGDVTGGIGIVIGGLVGLVFAALLTRLVFEILSRIYSIADDLSALRRRP